MAYLLKTMTFSKHIENIKNVILNPLQAWLKVNTEQLIIRNFFSGIVLFALTIVFTGRLLGTSLELLPVSSIYYILLFAFFSFIWEMLSLYLSIISINKLLPSYKQKENIQKVSVLIFYSLIPYYSAIFIINLFPSTYFFFVFSLYGLFIYWNGIKRFLRFKTSENFLFFIISSLIIIGIHLFMRFIVVLPVSSFL